MERDFSAVASRLKHVYNSFSDNSKLAKVVYGNKLTVATLNGDKEGPISVRVGKVTPPPLECVESVGNRKGEEREGRGFEGNPCVADGSKMMMMMMMMIDDDDVMRWHSFCGR